MSSRTRGYALSDALLSFLVLALSLAPLIVLQQQAERDARQNRIRTRVVWLALGTADRCRGEPAAMQARVLAEARQRLASVSGDGGSAVRIVGGDAARQLVFIWRDGVRSHRLEWPLGQP
jgi:Tfp pilus assembly protein PilV